MAVLVSGLSLAACTTAREESAPSPDRIFHADPRWLGGDAAYSVRLSEDRILWLFGDSFVDLEAPYRRGEAGFPRNTVAVQTGSDPRTAAMAFTWRMRAGQPTSFFPDDGEDWFWPGDGVRLDDGSLAIFLHRVHATAQAPPLGFEVSGYALVLVANPADPPAVWRMRRIDAHRMPFDAVPGATALRDGHFVVVLAVRQDGSNAGTFVRYRAADLARGDLSAGQWWAGSRGWLPADQIGVAGPGFVLSNAGPESSIHWDNCANAFVHVVSLGFGDTDIVMQTAPALTGPWSAPRAVLRPPESSRPSPFVYAAKAHSELEPPASRTTYVTYVVSSFSPDALLTAEGQRDLYWPRFASVSDPPCRR